MDLTKPKGIKNPAKGVVWVDLTKTIVRKKNPAKGGIWVDLTKDKKKSAKGGLWVDLTKTIVIKNPAKG